MVSEGAVAPVAVIVLNWNNAEDTLRCLTSLERLTYPEYEILVIDNASTDDSVPLIRAAYPQTTLIETCDNLGYAGGSNVGIECALAQGAEYVCILNNDVMVAAGFLSPLLRALQQEPRVGIVTPMICEMETRGRTWALGGAVDSRTGIVHRLHVGEESPALKTRMPFEVDVASGAAMLATREVFHRVGLFDEAFYLYFEETDWCLRAKKAGYRILAVPSSVVWHKVSATLGQTSPVVDYYMLRNHLRLIARHWSGAARFRLLGRTITRNLATIAAYTAKPHGGQRLPHRNARLMALRDAMLGRWGRMGPEVEAVCFGDPR